MPPPQPPPDDSTTPGGNASTTRPSPSTVTGGGAASVNDKAALPAPASPSEPSVQSTSQGSPRTRMQHRTSSSDSSANCGRDGADPQAQAAGLHSSGASVSASASPEMNRVPSSSSSQLRIPIPMLTPGQLTFSALQFLPSPLLVLDGLKTVVMANEAMGRLLGMMSEDGGTEDVIVSVTNQLRGQSLPQVGIDMARDGRPLWVDWNGFLDRMVAETRSGKTRETDATTLDGGAGWSSPGRDSSRDDLTTDVAHQPGLNTVVEVIISRKDLNRRNFDPRVRSNALPFQSYAKMLITVFEAGEQQQTYFTLTFTNTDSTPSHVAPSGSGSPTSRRVASSKILDAADQQVLVSASHPASVASCDSNSSSYRVSPTNVPLSSSPFPPFGPPSKPSVSSSPSILQKMTIMKDTLLDNTETPILAMWKDGSAILPNKAARKFIDRNIELDTQTDGFDLLPAWTVWNEDFTRQLDPSEYPISVLIRTETPSTGQRIGMIDENGRRVVFDILGEAVRDNITGEFLAGVVTHRDITKFTQEIDQIKAEDAERFRLICDTMPQLIWTTDPEGNNDFFNNKWYSYTGLSREESLGQGWMRAFHPDDLGPWTKRWRHSLETGEPFIMECRCRSGDDGQWRWFLARALPQRSKQTDKIETWFGTCTDVNESIEAKIEAKRMRQQLLSVITHSHITIFNIDMNRRVTMLEGALIWDSTLEDSNSEWYIGKNVYEVFNRLNSALPAGQRPQFLQPIEAILAGNAAEELQEHQIEGRWYRTRFLPVLGKQSSNGASNDTVVEGVTSVIMDVTELKAREADIAAQMLEKQQLIANEAAAKEASRLKSQFLANMSHEIRTPITGVIGMAELMKDLELSKEQYEYTENIYRSANALLTVINDILDFSKVESGRLDIEEVQFSLSVVINDVNRILRFAAQKKNLDFISEISPSIEKDMVVMGDPGRVRQIITNLLTNSIKFTNQGYVKFSVLKEKETEETVEIRFVVEDTGVGIEEEVRKRLFQPFSQGDASTARKFGGTGLGLTICKNLLELMHGRMTLGSQLGAGTTATFWIPFNRPQRAQASVQIDALPDRLASEMSVSCNSSELEQLLGTPPVETPVVAPSSPVDKAGPRRHLSLSMQNPNLSLGLGLNPPGLGTIENDIPMLERAKIHVLVVEDNAINQQIATKTIEKLGFQVTAAWNGREALGYLDAAREGRQKKPDVILMDVQMPVIDGYRCTHFLRHHKPYSTYVRDVPIVAMTASAIQGDKEKCERAGMDDYMSKPVKSNMLERMLVRWLGSRRDELLTRPRASPPSSVCSEADCGTAELASPGIETGTGTGGVEASSQDATPADETPDAKSPAPTIYGDKPSLSTPRATQENSLLAVDLERGDHFPGFTISVLEESPREGKESQRRDREEKKAEEKERKRDREGKGKAVKEDEGKQQNPSSSLSSPSSSLSPTSPSSSSSSSHHVPASAASSLASRQQAASTAADEMSSLGRHGHHHLRRISVEELALHSRDDKLMGAADGENEAPNHDRRSLAAAAAAAAAAAGTPWAGERLTEENVGKLGFKRG